MCAVLSQFGYHTEAIENANKASVLSEDNILRTYHLYSLIELNRKEINGNEENKEKDEELNKEADKQNENVDENSESYIQKMIQEEKVTECEMIMKALSLLINKNRELQKKQEADQNYSLPKQKIGSKEE